MLEHEVDFHIRGDVEKFTVSAVAAQKVEIHTVPDFVRQKETAFSRRQSQIKNGIDKDILPVGRRCFATAVNDGDEILTDEKSTDKGLIDQKPDTISFKTSGGLDFELFLLRIG